ncbi:MAG: hypothetical protein VX619_04095, partial [bacterium]|nr:hypothetical protein [bacterium]
MLRSFILILLIVVHSASFEFKNKQCIKSSVPKLCHVTIDKQNSEKNGSTPIKIQVKINRSFERIPLDQQDVIERQIISNRMRQQSSNLYGMDQGSAALVQIMSSF